MMCNNLATLLWLGHMADLELHTWFSRINPEPDMDLEPNAEEDDYLAQYPDFIIFDIDPYIYSGKEASGDEPELNRRAFKKTRDTAYWLKEKLDSLSLPSFVKTSGKTGLHVYVPVLRQFDYYTVRTAAMTVCSFVFREHSDLITLEWAVEKRAGKIFLDYNQNVKGKTLAAPYSPRPVPGACVSVPLNWDELESVYPTDHTILNTPDRLKKNGDPWADILAAKSDLAALLIKKEP
jgi:bifunctional non-homologous end joining protein LigD